MSSHTSIMMFETQFRAGTDSLRNSARKLSAALLSHETATGRRTRARKAEDHEKFDIAVEALGCNLIVAAATGSEASLAVPRSSGVMWSGASKSNPVYGSHFLVAIELLADLGLVEEGRRGFRYSPTQKMPSTIRATGDLNEYLPMCPPDWRSVQEIDDEVLVLLKGRKVDGSAEAQPFPANVRTRQLAREMRHINAMLRNAKIEIAGVTDSLSLDTSGHIVVPFRRSLRRIFNNSNWQSGGRLFGGFWLSMRRDERHRIILEGEETKEVDYRQLYPRLAYARAQQPQPHGDLYDILGDGTGRDGWKKLFNAMLFSKGPLKNWPKGTLQHFQKGTKLREACDMLSKRHAPVARLFGKEMGYSFMRIESDLLIRVMTNLAAMGHVSLPLHDAVLVAKSNVDAAAQIMREAFEAGTGTPFCAIVSVK